jgi:hypothetical protein
MGGALSALLVYNTIRGLRLLLAGSYPLPFHAVTSVVELLRKIILPCPNAATANVIKPAMKMSLLMASHFSGCRPKVFLIRNRRYASRNFRSMGNQSTNALFLAAPNHKNFDRPRRASP